MSGIANFFAEGGWAMYFIVLLGLAGLSAGVVQLVLAKKLDLTAVVVGIMALTLVIGIFGSVLGWIATFSAVAMVDPDMKMALLSRGFAEALTCTIFATSWVLLQLLVAAAALTLRANSKA